MKRGLPESFKLTQRNIQTKQVEKNMLFNRLRRSPFIPAQFDNERADPLGGPDAK